MPIEKKLYFASDFHLGAPDYEQSRNREDKIVRWLDEIRSDCSELFLMGDLFDYWFEYKSVVPRGFVRLMAVITRFTDSGIPVYVFKGNHDMWTFGYLEKELGVKIVSNEMIMERNGKKFFLHHGDGLGPGDRAYKLLKALFRSPVNKWLFSRLHPNLGTKIATMASGRSRIQQSARKEVYQGDDKEILYQFCTELLKKEHFDYMIFGHRHLALDIKIRDNSRYINLGEWFKTYSYGVFDGKDMQLKFDVE